MRNIFNRQSSDSTPSNGSQENELDPTITCPFLRMAQPDTSNLWRFVRDCEKNGFSFFMSLAVSARVVQLQKGGLALLRAEAPDLYKLDQVESVSHKDRYLPYLPEVKAKMQALSRNGKISIQDLVDIKEWIAAQEGVPIIQMSKAQPIILFVRAGGDLDSGLIDMDDALRMIEGYEPKKGNVVTLDLLKQAGNLVTWSDSEGTKVA